jgi:hypothetical protein
MVAACVEPLPLYRPRDPQASDLWRLAEIVPAGARYGFDLIAHVGVETYLQGRSLQEVREELARRRPAVDIPLSSLWDQQQRFLF